MKTTNGTLLAFAEGRVHNCGDAGDIDIVLKRSTDGGRTWGPLQVVNEGGGDTHGNPAPDRGPRDRPHPAGRDVQHGPYGRPQLRRPVRPHARICSTATTTARTWSEPRDLSDEILPAHWNSWYATGPVHGIQLTRGRHAGRLVFGVNTETWDGQSGHAPTTPR